MVIVSWPWPPGDISAWKQESPVGSAFRGGPGLGEFLSESEAMSGVDRDAWGNLLNSSSVNVVSLGFYWCPGENTVSGSL